MLACVKTMMLAGILFGRKRRMLDADWKGAKDAFVRNGNVGKGQGTL